MVIGAVKYRSSPGDIKNSFVLFDTDTCEVHCANSCSDIPDGAINIFGSVGNMSPKYDNFTDSILNVKSSTTWFKDKTSFITKFLEERRKIKFKTKPDFKAEPECKIKTLKGILGVADFKIKYTFILEWHYVYGTPDWVQSSGGLSPFGEGMYSTHRSTLRINNFEYKAESAILFLYPVKCGDWLILRFIHSPLDSELGFFSVAVSPDGETKFWSDDYKKADDKAFALKTDLVLRGV